MDRGAARRPDEQEARLAVQPPVRHPPAARRPDPARCRRCERSTVDHAVSDGHRGGCRRSVRARRHRRAGAARGGTRRRSGRPRPRRRPPRRRPPRSRRSPACPIPSGASLDPARADGEDRQHRRRPGRRRHRPGRRRVRRGGRGRHHALRRDLQLARARLGRPGALGAPDRPEHRVADRRRLRLLGRRAVRDRRASTPRRCTRSTRTRAGDAMFRDDRASRRDAPHNLYAHVDQLFVALRRRRRCRRRRCSRTAPPARRPSGAPALGVHVGFDAGYDRHVDVGRARPARGSASIDGGPRRWSRRPGRIAPKNVVVHVRAVHGRRGVEGRGAAHRRGRRAGCSPTARCVTGTWIRPDKTQPRAATSTPTGKPIQLHARPDVGRAAPTDSYRRRDRRPGARHHGTAGDRGAGPTTSRGRSRSRPRRTARYHGP